MSTGTTTHIGLTTVDEGDILPQSVTNANFQTIDGYVAARALTNKSGSTLAANSVVIADTTADSAFTTTTTVGNAKVIGVTQASIANDATGIVKMYGVSNVLVTGATSRGDWLRTSTTAGKAESTSSSGPVNGAFAIALSSTVGTGTVVAMLLTAAGTPAVISLPVSATPTTTTEGVMEFSSTYDVPTVGIGAATKHIGLVRGAGLTSSATKEVVIDSTTANLSVWDGTSARTFSMAPWDLFRSGRRVFAEVSARAVTLSSTDGTLGLTGTGATLSSNSGTPPTIANVEATGAVDTYVSVATGAAAIISFGSHTSLGTVSGGSLGAAVRPDKNPRMSIRWFPGAGNANLDHVLAGFLAGGATSSPTANGAYLRANTTGNLFFVTRQGGAETTTDLGARPTAPTSYEVYTEDAGVTWKCYNITTATTVATHTGDVPTATTALAYAIGARSTSGSLNAFNLSYFRVECGQSAA